MKSPTQNPQKRVAFLGYLSAYGLLPMVVGCLFMVFLPYSPLLLTAEFHRIDSARLLDWLGFVFSWTLFNASFATGLYALLMSIVRIRRFGLPARLGLSMLGGGLTAMTIGKGLVIADLFGVLGLFLGLLLEVKISFFVYSLNELRGHLANRRSQNELKTREN